MKPLTPRQREVLTLTSQGLSHQQIALKLDLKYQTVKNHFWEAYERLGLEGQRRRPFPAIMKAVRTGQITLSG
jgi:DNA-binding NarL/FixJ family response regulator